MMHLLNINNIKKTSLKRRNNAQVAAEFTILLGFALLTTMIVIIFLFMSGKDRSDEKIDYKMYDFGSSLQNEFILAYQMNDGYVRMIHLDDKIEYTDYNITILSQTSIMISYAGKNLYFRIPLVNGTLSEGNNYIMKVGEEIHITQ